MKKDINETVTSGGIGAHSIATRPMRDDGKEPIRREKTRFADYLVSGKYKNADIKMKVVKLHKKKENVTESERITVDDILSRLSGLENDNPDDLEIGDITSFGIEDDEGNLVKVSIADKDSERFEERLAEILADEIEASKAIGTFDGETASKSTLPELIYKLKDEFEILDLEFPEIPKDAIYDYGEIDQELSSEEDEGFDDSPELDDEFGDENDEFGDENDEFGGVGDDTGSEFDDETEAETDDGSVEDFDDDFSANDDSEEDMLSQVLNMMKAQAEAEIEKAKAETEKAKAKQAEYEAKATENTIKNQEELLRMEKEMEEQKEEEKEADKLAQLAKYRMEKMGESVSKEFIDVIKEFDESETEQVLRRQRMAINQKYTPSPEDTPEQRREKNIHKREELKQLQSKLKQARAHKKTKQIAAKREEENQEQQQNQQGEEGGQQ